MIQERLAGIAAVRPKHDLAGREQVQVNRYDLRVDNVAPLPIDCRIRNPRELHIDIIEVVLGGPATRTGAKENAALIPIEARDRKAIDHGNRRSTERGQDDADIRKAATGPHNDLCVDPLPSGQIDHRRRIDLGQDGSVKMDGDVVIIYLARGLVNVEPDSQRSDEIWFFGNKR